MHGRVGTSKFRGRCNWASYNGSGTTRKVGPTYFSKLTFRGVRTLFLDVCSDVAKQRWRSAFQRSRYVVVTHRCPTQKSGSQTQPKTTSDECYDDVRRRVYPGTSQRIISNRDHKCSKRLPWATLVYALPLYLAAT
jgi:hypothetical protein